MIKTKWITIQAYMVLFSLTTLFAQKEKTWDSTAKNDWNPAFKKVEIPSMADGKIQNAFLYASKSKEKKPLIVSLHTWSGDYTQKDPLANEILARDWNYIHPDFRGKNNTAEASCSPLVISDLEDAIQYALKNTNTNPEEVHLIGVSGGGLATLAAYMNLKYPVKSFSAWAPISDLEAWYWESVGRQQKYAADILSSTSKDSILNSGEARLRSPLYQNFPKELRKNAKLYLYEGVHDGYTGSVPISQTINMYNRLVGELKYNSTNLDDSYQRAVSDSDLVSEKEIIGLLTKRYNPNFDKRKKLFDRDIYLYRQFGDIQLNIFEGTHEQLPQALGFLPVSYINNKEYTILTLGDSNAEHTDGWVTQLKAMLPNSNIVNISKSGRTIGFNNQGRNELNALANIDEYLNQAQKQIAGKKYDYVIVCLGTNDTKKEFANIQNEVLPNFETLLDKIKKHPLSRSSKPTFIYVTPPPIRTYDILDKYSGSNERIQTLVPQLIQAAEKRRFKTVDVYHPLLGILDYYSTDGVHMKKSGQEIIASKIIECMLQKK